jgi:hypothetical protein
MAAVLIIVGALMAIVGVRGTYGDFGKLLVTEFQGAKSFLWFAVAVGVLAALGNVKELKPVTNAFLLLVLVVLILSQQQGTAGGFFASLMAQLQASTVPGANVANPAGGSGLEMPVSSPEHSEEDQGTVPSSGTLRTQPYVAGERQPIR